MVSLPRLATATSAHHHHQHQPRHPHPHPAPSTSFILRPLLLLKMSNVLPQAYHPSHRCLRQRTLISRPRALRSANPSNVPSS